VASRVQGSLESGLWVGVLVTGTGLAWAALTYGPVFKVALTKGGPRVPLLSFDVAAASRGLDSVRPPTPCRGRLCRTASQGPRQAPAAHVALHSALCP
jgi:hypothetical protein